MSFEQNDIIHLGNYEEFFILYMDNELNEEQMQMVDDFLISHPDLQAEFELLMNTKLPAEEFSFDKNELLADKMKVAAVDEELLLYIDNELPANQRNIVEFELAANKDYRLQHQILLQAKLDPSEPIAYPNKRELYRHTDKVIFLKPWMRVAAAVIIIAFAGVWYFINTTSKPMPAGTSNIANVSKPIHQQEERSIPAIKQTPKEEVAIIQTVSPSTKPKATKDIENSQQHILTQDVAQNNPSSNQHEENIPVTKTTAVDFNDRALALNEPKVSINNPDVTSPPLERNTIVDPPSGPTTNNDRKGSVRGFLRKASRMIERKVGIDPANDNGEVLIGAVAVSLK